MAARPPLRGPAAALVPLLRGFWTSFPALTPALQHRQLPAVSGAATSAVSYFCSSSGREQRVSDVVIVGYARTPQGCFQGGLSSLSAPQLGSVAIKGALEGAGVRAEEVQEVYMGNVLSAGLGQAPARQAALGAGLPASVVCTTLNKVCSSGLKAIVLAAQSIALGVNQVAVAGGMESMSNAPYVLPRAVPERRMGDLALRDSMLTDGLWDPHGDMHMGSIAEACAKDMRISRSDQDEYAIKSYERALSAQATGILGTQIVPVTIPEKKGKPPTVITADEECSRFDPEKLKELPPAFRVNGSVTAGNSSAISDGAAAVVLTSAEYAKERGLSILATVRGYGDAEQAPDKFPTSPTKAIPRALKHAGLELKDVDQFELNEAFAVVALANELLLGLDEDQMNIHGGGISLGHPIGASGARVVMSLLTTLAIKQQDIGVAAICNGGGGASALVLEREKSFALYLHTHGRWGKEKPKEAEAGEAKGSEESEVQAEGQKAEK